MSERITKADVDRIADTCSHFMSAGCLSAGKRIQRQGRNGYQGLDLYVEGTLIRTLFCGTMRECYTFLQGWRQSDLTG